MERPTDRRAWLLGPLQTEAWPLDWLLTSTGVSSLCPAALLAALTLLLLPALTWGQCPVPEHLSFAFLLNKTDLQAFPIGTTLKYQCRPGYNKRHFLLTCLLNSKWTSPPSGVCKKKLCQLPPDVQNGRVNVTSLEFGADISYTCEEGYRLIGESSATCLISGNKVIWDPDPPICDPIPCESPPTIANGRITKSLSNFLYGMVVTYECHKTRGRMEQFQLVGEKSIYCTSRDNKVGEWSGPAPLCIQKNKCMPPDVKNGLWEPGNTSLFNVGQTVQLQCQPGFDLEGPDRVQCASNNKWTPSLPTCSRRCQPPPEILHGQHTAAQQGHFTPGDRVSYICEPGYWLDGAASLHCTPQGAWSPSAPRCTERLCTAFVRQPLHGRVHLPVRLQPGAKVSFECDEGYLLRGSAVLHCVLVEGQSLWNGSTPDCEQIFCAPPKPIPNGRHSGGSLAKIPYGKEVTYTCNAHPDPHMTFNLVGKGTIRCGSNRQGLGVWSSPAPRCEPARIPGQSCTVPKNPLNGRVQMGSDTQVGSTLYYSCDKGYQLIGSPTATCILSGQHVNWDKEAPHCEKIFCAPPQPIPNGRHSGGSLASIPYGEEVTYTCDAHPDPHMTFHLIGNGTIRCGSNRQGQGVWSSPAPRCEPARIPGRSCTVPSNPLNGRVWTGSDTQVGSTLYYSCDKGYQLIGSPSATCILSGQHVNWDKEAPHCEKINCAPPQPIPNGRHSGGSLASIPYGEEVTYTCDAHPDPHMTFHLIGNGTIRCGSNLQGEGVWSSPAPRCEPARIPGQSCTVPTNPLNGRVWTGSDTQVGSTLYYSCDKGYQLIGSPSATCILSGQHVNWDKEAPHCEKIFCAPPQPISNGRHSGGSLSSIPYGEEVTYTCDAHPDPHMTFHLIGNGTIRCGSNLQGEGVWSSPAPRCEPTRIPGQSCTVPTNPLNGRVWTGSDTQVGSTLYYSCDKGYRLTGSPTATCILSGQHVNWDKEAPHCEKIFCAPPQPITNGRHSGGSLASIPYGEEVTYTCDTHPDPHMTFNLIGVGTIYCVSNRQDQGVWSGPAPRCEPARTPGLILECPPPPKILHGHFTEGHTSPYHPGMSINYICDPGYVPVDGTFMYCTHLGTWSATNQVCREVVCHLPHLVNGIWKESTAQTVYRFGDNVTVQCNSGHTMEGSPWSQCQANGTWAPPLALCMAGAWPTLLAGSLAAVIIFILLLVTSCWLSLWYRKGNSPRKKCEEVNIHLHSQEDKV